MVRRFFIKQRAKLQAKAEEAIRNPVKRALLSQSMEIIVSCCLAAIGLKVLDPDDMRVAKVVIYSRAVTNAVHLFGETTGLYKPVESSSDPRRFTVESLLALTASTFLCYAFTFESGAMPPSFRKTFIAGTNMNKDEMTFFDALRAIREIELRMRRVPNGGH